MLGSSDSVLPVFINPYASVNIKTHIPIKLDLRLPNYNKWNVFFTAMCGKFDLLGHIDGTITSRPTDPTWNQPDACVRSWMYGSVSDGVLDLAMAPDQTARALYTAIRDLFQANQEPRAVILNQEFSSLSQGDLPIEAYASQLKQTADALRDVGHPILDRQLVLNLLNGINPRLANTADIIANTRPLPTFTEAVNMLRLKELCLANDNKTLEAGAPSSPLGPGSGGAGAPPPLPARAASHLRLALAWLAAGPGRRRSRLPGPLAGCPCSWSLGSSVAGGAATGPGAQPCFGAACGLVAAAAVRSRAGIAPPVAAPSSLSLTLLLVAVLDVRALGSAAGPPAGSSTLCRSSAFGFGEGSGGGESLGLLADQ
ncbi:uncharacterized protein LOC120659087 [Panicum virgatum]|uniref:uncharacterized protein LOC120659087 n=1 Tax=Panicum virgatum TaxID=38727 RepID=UPI0019D5D89C|nr:uncharacterized protein LOC120659087 [Panicum virgatum]